MSYADGIITAPVGIADVQQALGEYSTTDLGALCRSDAINKWSLHKPIRKAARLTPLVDADFVVDNYALTPRSIGEFNFVSMFGLLDEGGVWIYRRPEGGLSQPYRLTDFDGYNQRQKPWVDWGSIMFSPKIYDDLDNNGLPTLDYSRRHFSVTLKLNLEKLNRLGIYPHGSTLYAVAWNGGDHASVYPLEQQDDLITDRLQASVTIDVNAYAAEMVTGTCRAAIIAGAAPSDWEICKNFPINQPLTAIGCGSNAIILTDSWSIPFVVNTRYDFQPIN